MITQIYEIQTAAEAEEMIGLGVDHIGTVVTDSVSWKQEEIRETIGTVKLAGAKSSLILLFDDVERICLALDYYRPDIIHFCQSVIDTDADWETACGRMISLQATVRERFPQIAIMRSIPIPRPGTRMPVPMMALARYFEPLSDFFLTDTYLMAGSGQTCADQPVAGYIGITGMACDWQMAAELVASTQIPVILAGGLGPDNVYDGIVETRPAGVDSCTRTNAVDESGVPIRFRKDRKKVAHFLSEARRALARLKRSD